MIRFSSLIVETYTSFDGQSFGPYKLVKGDIFLHGEKVGDIWMTQTKGFTLKGGREYIELSSIKIDKEKRGKGYAEGFMQELCKYADAHDLGIVLTPSSDFGASKTRLTAWYRTHGFVPNSGRNKDFKVRETMIRLPS